MRRLRHLIAPRFAVHRPLVVIALALGLVAGACSVDVDRVTMTRAGLGEGAAPSEADAGATGDEAVVADGGASLPVVGPAPGSSHWHAAYVFRICDDVLAPFTEENDPLGIHTHGDGLIHIHPFFEEAGFEQATLERFAEAVGFTLGSGELGVPGGGTWRDGDLCNGVPGRVFVDRWSGPDPETDVTRIFDDPEDIRFEADGELYQIAFAPADSPPVVPPTWPLLFEVSNLLLDVPEPWVRVEGAPAEIRFADVADVTAAPCAAGQLPEAVLSGAVACFTLGERMLTRDEAVVAARAVSFNRQPAVELTITPAFRSFIVEPFLTGEATDRGLVIAVIVDDEVVTAPLLVRPSASEDRLILAGGLSVDSARALASQLDG